MKIGTVLDALLCVSGGLKKPHLSDTQDATPGAPRGTVTMTGKSRCLATVPAVAMAAALLLADAPAHAAAPDTCAPPPPSTLVVNVKDKGAKGDGKTDDTKAIQAAIEAAAGTKSSTVLVPAGTYMVDVDYKRTLKLKSDMTLKLAPGATLKAFPTDQPRYAMLWIKDVSNVWVIGGTFYGERDQHKGKGGQYGYGIRIGGSGEHDTKHITVIGVTAKKMWADGFNVFNATDVRFCSVTADANRRQGMSVAQADGLLVANSVFKNTSGTRPSAGIDLEPAQPEQHIRNVRILESKFINNTGAGIIASAHTAQVSNVEMRGNVFEGNTPIRLINAQGAAATVCGNRQLTKGTDLSGGLNAYADPVKSVSIQEACGDMSFIKSKTRKPPNKNKKKKG